MANELRFNTTTGLASTYYVNLVRSRDDFYYNTSLTALEAYNASNFTSYAISVTETGATGSYKATFPAAITSAGVFVAIARKKIGGSAATTDTIIATGTIGWDGAKEVSVLDAIDIEKINKPSASYWFVGASGDDSNDGLTWATRKLTINSAISNAANGDTIVIGKGFYAERMNSSSKTLHIIGAGWDSTNGTVITGSGTGPTVSLGSGSTLRDLKIAPAGGDSIAMEGNIGVRVTRCYIKNANSNSTAYNTLYSNEVIEDSILEATNAVSDDGGLPLVYRTRLLGAVSGSIIAYNCYPESANTDNGDITTLIALVQSK